MEGRTVEATTCQSSPRIETGMKPKSLECKSARQALNRVVAALEAENLEFSFDKKAGSVLIPMAGSIQSFTVQVQVTPTLLLFLIPYYLTIPKDLDPERRKTLLEKSLRLNDKFGLIKMALGQSQRLVLSVEVPWKYTILTPAAINTFLGVLNGAAKEHQREFLETLLR